LLWAVRKFNEKVVHGDFKAVKEEPKHESGGGIEQAK